ncbi:MAG: class I SAM-dependent methyltransferase [Parachlamydiales bacterium]|nr:class I SAM-dependent methyltransferase [Parachlamydiales bacterium]
MKKRLKKFLKKCNYCPIKFRYINKLYGKNKVFNILDVGCGNDSALYFKDWFPKADSYGLDNDNYNNSKKSFDIMKQFYNIDLVKNSLDIVPDNFFDVISMNHVVEHLPNSIAVVKNLSKKLKPEGQFYVEFPSTNSLSFPSAIGTLHFCDDDSHIRIYDIKDIANAMLESDIKIIKAGKVRDYLNMIIFFPRCVISQIKSWKKHKKLHVKDFLWHYFGFCHYVLGEKRKKQ